MEKVTFLVGNFVKKDAGCKHPATCQHKRKAGLQEERLSRLLPLMLHPIGVGGIAGRRARTDLLRGGGPEGVSETYGEHSFHSTKLQFVEALYCRDAPENGRMQRRRPSCFGHFGAALANCAAELLQGNFQQIPKFQSPSKALGNDPERLFLPDVSSDIFLMVLAKSRFKAEFLRDFITVQGYLLLKNLASGKIK